MRDFFQDTIVTTGADGKVTALPGVKVEVYYANTTDLARIFESYDPENMLQVENPRTTDATGSVYFYADVGEYDIVLNDPANLVGLTSFRWNAVNASPGGLPLFVLGDDIRRQLAQIGEVIDWWRPAPQVPLPAGFVVPLGQTIPADEHDFTDATGAPLGTAITLPDMTNAFVLGADVRRADGAASANGDSVAGPGGENLYAPGIGGTGGTNTARDLRHTHQYAHTHGVPFIDHTHNGTAADHMHTAGNLFANDHGHALAGTGATADAVGSPAGYIATSDYQPGAFSRETHVHGLTGAAGSSGGNILVGGTTAVADRSLAYTTAGSNTTTGTTTNSQSTTTTDLGTLTNPGGVSTPQDFRPKHIGLLKLMKVRWA